MKSEEYYFDENDKTVSKEEAKKVIIRETDDKGHIYETFGFFEPKEKPKNDKPIISDEELMKKYNELFNKK